MADNIRAAAAEMQGQLFALSASAGYSSESFIKVFMTSHTAKISDVSYPLRPRSKEYLFSLFEDECENALERSGEIFDRNLLYWIGYVYKYWALTAGIGSAELYAAAPVKTMTDAFTLYAGLPICTVIDRLTDDVRAAAPIPEDPYPFLKDTAPTWRLNTERTEYISGASYKETK